MHDKRPDMKPVTKIELNTANEKRRWIVAGILLLVGVAAIAFGVSQALTVQPGWEEVQVQTQEASVASEFKLQYDFSETGGSAAAVNKALIRCYEEAAVKAYRLFSSEVEAPELRNMAYLNKHPNEVVTVDAALYQALSQVVASQSRQLFLAPAQVEYQRVFLCETDGEAALYDPARNGEVKAWLMELSHYVDDPAHISLEILEQDQVKLAVSQEYLAFAQENGITVFADFGWLTNAFAADLIADALTAQGFTSGYLASYDGFTRNLDASGAYTQNLFVRQGTAVDLPGRMHYTAPASIVVLRDYPMSGRDKWHYYGFEDGTIITTFLDSADGMSKSALSDLVAYSREKGCGEIALEAAKVFIADTFQPERLARMKESGIHAIWPEGKTLCYNDRDVTLELLSDSGPGYETAQK